MDRKPLTNEQIMDLMLFADIGGGEQVFVCDLCGAFAKNGALLKHRLDCPEVKHGD